MKFLQILKKHPIIFVMILILVLFLPAGLSAPPEGLDFIHATSIGIDESEEGIEVSILAFVITPSKNYSESFYFLSAKAQNPAEAVELIAHSVGKRVVLAHAGVVVLGNEFAKNGVIEELNYLFRSHTIANDVFLITTNVTAKEFLQAEQKLITDAGIRLEEVGVYNQKNSFFNDINLDSFYKGYFSESKTSVTAYMELLSESQSSQSFATGESSSGSESQSGENQKGGSSGSQKTQEKKFIQNLSRASVFYDGKLKTVLSEEETKGINWTSTALHDVKITIDNVNDENFSNAQLVYKVENVSINKKGYFVRGVPVVEYNVLLIVDIDEVVSEVGDITNNITSGKTYLTSTVKKKIESQVKKEFSKGLNNLIINSTDALDALKILQKGSFSQTKKWLDSLNIEYQKDYLRFIDFRMSVSIRASR